MSKKILVVLVGVAIVILFAVCLIDKPNETTNPTIGTDPTEQTTPTKPSVNAEYYGFKFTMVFDCPEQVIYQDDDITWSVVKLFWDDVDGLRFWYKIEDKQGRKLDITVPSYGFEINDSLIKPYDDYVEEDGVLGRKFTHKDLAFYGIDSVFDFAGRDFSICDTATGSELATGIDFSLTIHNDGIWLVKEFDGEVIPNTMDLGLYFAEGRFGLHDEICPLLYMHNISDTDLYILIKNIRIDNREGFDAKDSDYIIYSWSKRALNLQKLIEIDHELNYNEVQKVTIDIEIRDNKTDELLGYADDYEIEWNYDPVYVVN